MEHNAITKSTNMGIIIKEWVRGQICSSILKKHWLLLLSLSVNTSLYLALGSFSQCSLHQLQ